MSASVVRGARMSAWRAHAYGGLAELRLESARVPPLRRPTDLLVQVEAASLNPIDVAMLEGYGSRILNTLRRLEGDEVEFPLVPGRDLCGRVVQAGRAARLRPGQRVWAVLPPHRAGALAQYALVPERWAGPAPAALSPLEAGGALYAGLTAASAVRVAGLRGAGRGARVLLLGLGGVGQAALQLLVHEGARVTVGCAPDLADTALELGAAAVLDRHAPDYDHQLETCGPYEAVLDCAGAGGWEAGARRWRFARYVTLSTPLLRETDARGLWAGAGAALCALGAQAAGAARAGGSLRWAYFAPRRAEVEALRALAERGRFRVVVERAWPWWEAAEALRHVAQGHARGKVLLDFTARQT